MKTKADNPLVWLNHRLVPRSEARISVDDWGFLYGDTLFETIRVVAGRPLAWGLHMRRFFRSARLLNHRVGWSPSALLDALGETLDANGLLSAAARITLTRGGNPDGFRFDGATGSSLLITVRPFDGPTDDQLRTGIRLETVRVPERTGWPRHRTKSGNYLDSLLALDVASTKGSDEALLVDRQGRILEGARSTAFLVVGKHIFTPPLRLGILPGVMRALVLRWARGAGLPVAVRSVRRSMIGRASEMFMTNSLWGVMPVRTVDGDAVGNESPGPVTRTIIRRLNRWTERARKGASGAA